MFDKNRNKTVGICVMVVTACLILAGLWTVLATPETALANKPPHDHGGDDGGKTAVTVTFRDAGDAGADRIRSDGEGPYIDGVDRVTVEISSQGHFSFGVPKARGNKPVIRRLDFDFSVCHHSDDTHPGPCDNTFSGLGTGAMNVHGLDLRAMTEGVPTEVVLSGFFKPSEDVNARQYSFNPDRFDGSNLITVTKTDESPNTWVFKTKDFPNDVVGLKEVRAGDDIVRLYHMPFQITVVEEIPD